MNQTFTCNLINGTFASYFWRRYLWTLFDELGSKCFWSFENRWFVNIVICLVLIILLWFRMLLTVFFSIVVSQILLVICWLVFRSEMTFCGWLRLRQGMSDVSPLVLNRKAVIWSHFTISSLVLLPSLVTPSYLFIICLLAHSPDFSPENSSIFFVSR